MLPLSSLWLVFQSLKYKSRIFFTMLSSIEVDALKNGITQHFHSIDKQKYFMVVVVMVLWYVL